MIVNHMYFDSTLILIRNSLSFASILGQTDYKFTVTAFDRPMDAQTTIHSIALIRFNRWPKGLHTVRASYACTHEGNFCIFVIAAFGFQRFYLQLKDAYDDLMTSEPFQYQDYTTRSDTTTSMFLFRPSDRQFQGITQHPWHKTSRGNITISLEKSYL